MTVSKLLIILGLCAASSGVAFAVPLTAAQYCSSKGGNVSVMSVEYGSGEYVIQGLTKSFCMFQPVEGGSIHIGLEAFGSQNPSIAASFIQTLKSFQFRPDSPLWNGGFSNPSHNVCKNLGGSSTLVNVAQGSFMGDGGASDICVFGDGSMVSGWSLIYMAEGREGYTPIKDAVRSQALQVYIPRQ